MQAEHYDRTRQQQIDIGLLAPEEAQESTEQVLSILCLELSLLRIKATAQQCLQCCSARVMLQTCMLASCIVTCYSMCSAFSSAMAKMEGLRIAAPCLCSFVGAMP